MHIQACYMQQKFVSAYARKRALYSHACRQCASIMPCTHIMNRNVHEHHALQHTFERYAMQHFLNIEVSASIMPCSTSIISLSPSLSPLSIAWSASMGELAALPLLGRSRVLHDVNANYIQVTGAAPKPLEIVIRCVFNLNSHFEIGCCISVKIIWTWLWW